MKSGSPVTIRRRQRPFSQPCRTDWGVAAASASCRSKSSGHCGDDFEPWRRVLRRRSVFGGGNDVKENSEMPRRLQRPAAELASRPPQFGQDRAGGIERGRAPPHRDAFERWNLCGQLASFRGVAVLDLQRASRLDDDFEPAAQIAPANQHGSTKSPRRSHNSAKTDGRRRRRQRIDPR